MLKHNRYYYLKFFLVFVLFFFSLTYAVVNYDTIGKQVEIIGKSTSFFAKETAVEVFNISGPDREIINSETWRIETEIFDQINGIRAEKGLVELQWDPLLSRLSRRHSEDMAQNNYFNHTDLFGNDPNKRAKILGIKTTYVLDDIKYDGIGENIGLMPRGVVQDVGILITAEDIASGMVFRWMLSEPHKDNILEEDYTFTGIGVVYDSSGNYYITQNFQ